MRTSLKEHSPHLVDEWSEENYPLTPEKITYGSNKKVLWKGKCGHKYEIVMMSSYKRTKLAQTEFNRNYYLFVYTTYYCKRYL